MASHYHAVVWIDHHQARVIYFNADDAAEETIHPAHPPRQLHHHSGTPSGTHERGGADYYRDVADAIGEAKAVLVAGPSTAKTEFVTWLRAHLPQMADRMVGPETMPAMTDGQLVAEARRYFKHADRMRPP